MIDIDVGADVSGVQELLCKGYRVVNIVNEVDVETWSVLLLFQ